MSMAASFGSNLTGEERRGLLGQGSIRTVISYPTRTSPVFRGQWILSNILAGRPAPTNVPALKENNRRCRAFVGRTLEQHRANPVCAGCHKMMDPLGFALENFDAVGRWRRRAKRANRSTRMACGRRQQSRRPVSVRKALLKCPEDSSGF